MLSKMADLLVAEEKERQNYHLNQGSKQSFLPSMRDANVYLLVKVLILGNKYSLQGGDINLSLGSYNSHKHRKHWYFFLKRAIIAYCAAYLHRKMLFELLS